jgi:hypothetical protein
MSGYPPPMDEIKVSRVVRMRAHLDLSQQLLPTHARLVSRIMADQHVDGSWRSSTLAWTDVCTALAIEVLSLSGISIDARWEIPEGTGCLPRAFAYLSSTQEDGRWGSDWFDHAKVLRALAGFAGQLPERLAGELAQGYAELRVAMDREFAGDERWPTESDWSGSATVAAACMAFAMVDDQRSMAECLTKLRGMQRSDGSFAVETTLGALIPWHTANAVLALKVAGIPSSSPAILSALSWLREIRRTDDGSWGEEPAERRVDFTAYVAQAFFETEGPAAPEVSDTLSWLEAQQDADGSIGVLEGTLHGCVLLSRISGGPINVSLPLDAVVDVHHFLGELIRENDDTSNVVAPCEMPRSNSDSSDATYFARITNRQAVGIAFILGLLLAAIVIMGVSFV